jgi:uncharacterized protein (TIGR02453 family)
MPRSPSASFSPPFFDFFREISIHNERDWFQANRKRYERDVKEPLLAFIVAIGPKLAAISAEIVADPRPVGGSMLRIHRDTRFSTDKTRYKTWGAAHFRPKAGKDIHAPGYYLHLAPGEVFMGAGIWAPDSPSLERIRRAIVERPADWRRAAHAPGPGEGCSFYGDAEMLKRAPRGFPAEHEFADDLRRKHFVVTAKFSEKDACKAGFLDRYAASCAAAAPFMAFLARSVDVAW